MFFFGEYHCHRHRLWLPSGECYQWWRWLSLSHPIEPNAIFHIHWYCGMWSMSLHLRLFRMFNESFNPELLHFVVWARMAVWLHRNDKTIWTTYLMKPQVFKSTWGFFASTNNLLLNKSLLLLLSSPWWQRWQLSINVARCACTWDYCEINSSILC